VAHTVNPDTQEAEIGGLWFEACPDKIVKLTQKTGWVWWHTPVIPTTQEAKVGGLLPKPAPSKKHETLSEK
jgi:hypothetical protein